MNKNITRKKFNVSLLGESEVGKTLITSCYLNRGLQETSLSTIGIESYMDSAVFDNVEYKFKIYDTAGQERYKSISRSTIKITDGFLLVFSVDCKKSFDAINYWYNSIRDEIDVKKKIIYLIGNKIDLDKREIKNEEAYFFAQEKNIKYFETSAKTGYGVKEVFKQLYQDIYDLFKQNQNNKNNKSNNFVLNQNSKKENNKCC